MTIRGAGFMGGGSSTPPLSCSFGTTDAVLTQLVRDYRAGTFVGAGAGTGVGAGIGMVVGAGMGSCEGEGMGKVVGAGIGSFVGDGIGSSVGCSVGSGDGTSEGTGVGWATSASRRVVPQFSTLSSFSASSAA